MNIECIYTYSVVRNLQFTISRLHVFIENPENFDSIDEWIRYIDFYNVDNLNTMTQIKIVNLC